jgi:uncharacterized membrane protein YebE (DUF533 family)
MDLPELQALVERALADGKLTQSEMDEIMTAIMADDVVSASEMEILDFIERKILENEIELS